MQTDPLVGFLNIAQRIGDRHGTPVDLRCTVQAEPAFHHLVSQVEDIGVQSFQCQVSSGA